MEIRRVGPYALLIEVDDPAAWFAALSDRRAEGSLAAVDLVPGARTVLIDGVGDPAAVAEALPGWAPPAGTGAAPGPLVRIPVVYSGEDLPFVAAHWRLSVDEAVEVIAGVEFTVAFCGFAPGFAYLAGLPFPVPRLDDPRPVVPAGSVALAGEYAGIYPTASPGGWRLVGSTDVTLFDVAASPPALLTPGTRVRLERAC